jgi:hypothetical protein
MKDYINKEKPHIATAWDDIQARFGCCGLQNYQDWVGFIVSILSFNQTNYFDYSR